MEITDFEQQEKMLQLCENLLKVEKERLAEVTVDELEKYLDEIID